jgi:hypothetical protein
MDTGLGSGILLRFNSSVHGVVRQYDEIEIDQSFPKRRQSLTDAGGCFS